MWREAENGGCGASAVEHAGNGGSVKLLLTQKDAARLLGIKRQTVGRMFADGTLPTIVVGRRSYTTSKAVYRMVDAKLGPTAGPIEDSSQVQIVANRTISKRAEKPRKDSNVEWRQRYKR